MPDDILETFWAYPLPSPGDTTQETVASAVACYKDAIRPKVRALEAENKNLRELVKLASQGFEDVRAQLRSYERLPEIASHAEWALERYFDQSKEADDA